MQKNEPVWLLALHRWAALLPLPLARSPHARDCPQVRRLRTNNQGKQRSQFKERSTSGACTAHSLRTIHDSDIKMRSNAAHRCCNRFHGWHHSLCHHHLHKLLIVDLPVAVDISLPYHFVNFLVSELLAQVGHDMAQLCCADEAVAITVEYL